MAVGENDRDVILVLGMHRSGTSAFAGTLACLGLALPARLMAADTANASGYFESWELASLHNAMLRTAKSRWDDWSPIADDWFAKRAARGFAGRIVEFLDREFAGVANFVIKDPRICRVVPVWRDALARFGANPRVILPLRHPFAVAQSLMARDGFLPAKSYLLWLRHILDAERATLFLRDAEAGELFSRAVCGAEVSEIRIPQGVRIAGSVFDSVPPKSATTPTGMHASTPR